MIREHEKAQAWRLKNGWTLDDLSEKTGYSVSSIWWMEKGQSPPLKGSRKPRPVNVYAWQRFKRVCHSVHVETESGRTFTW